MRFFVEYQPVFHSATNTIAGLEALIRWQHPTEGAFHPICLSPMPKAKG